MAEANSTLISHQISFYQPHLWLDESSRPSTYDEILETQPFIKSHQLPAVDRLLLNHAQSTGQWTQWMNTEQTAFALGQVTAAQTLPSLAEYVTIAALLECRVRLRDFLNEIVVETLIAVLNEEGSSLFWNKVDRAAFLCVVGSGVAACIDTTPDEETLYLRYANEVANAISNAQNEADLPRSILGIQNILHERFDALLHSTRARTLSQLTEHSPTQ